MSTAEYTREWRIKNPDYRKIEYRRLKEDVPWLRHFYSINYRCTNKNYIDSKYYLGRGIRNFLTRDDVKLLWFRDKAFLLKKPTIDRRDSLKDYTIENCQFIEHLENSIKALSPSWKRRQNAH